MCQLKVWKLKKPEDKHDEYSLQNEERYALLVEHKSLKRSLVQVKVRISTFSSNVKSVSQPQFQLPWPSI